MTRDLPHRGLGLSSNLNAADHPRPYELLEDHPGAFDFLEYSAPLDLQEAARHASLFKTMMARREATPVLFHPVHLNLYGPTLESGEALAALNAHAKAVGSPWVGNDVAWWHEGGQAFPGYLYIAPPFSEAGIHDVAVHARHVQAHLDVPLVLENPAILRRNGPLHVLDFMAALHRETGCPLLLDMGHLWSFELATGVEVAEAFHRFPFDAVAEIHIAGGVVTERAGRRFYVDDHTQPIHPKLHALLREIRGRCHNLRALTFEGEGHPESLTAQTLRVLEPFRPNPALAKPLPAPEPRTPASTALRTNPWALFDEVHGITAPAEDAAGTLMEQDFRLAVLAEQLDAGFPLTRLLIAGSRAELEAFVRSEPYRGIFGDSGVTLEGAFARYARGLVRERPYLAPALSFETGAAQMLRLQSPLELPHGLTPGADTVTGVFPMNLEAVFFAATALRRHLTQRVWGSEILEPSGLSTLHDALAEARPEPWAVALRQRGPKLETFSLPSLTAPLRACRPARCP